MLLIVLGATKSTAVDKFANHSLSKINENSTYSFTDKKYKTAVCITFFPFSYLLSSCDQLSRTGFPSYSSILAIYQIKKIKKAENREK